MTVLNVSVQAFRRFVSLCYGIYCEFRTGEDVAADKYIGFGSLIRQFVRRRIISPAEFDFAAF